MFKKIADKITRQTWCARSPRFVRLDNYDRLIEGSFYDHLPSAFYDELDHSDEPIKIEDRRPSAQFRLTAWVARWSGRKLFAGRHLPRILHEDRAVARTVRTLARSSRLFRTMLNVTFYGSVGSVAVTFRVDRTDDQPTVSYTIWRAKHCQPAFDRSGDLVRLRVAYQARGAALHAIGAPLRREMTGPIEDPPDPANLACGWWFIRDWSVDEEKTYLPVRAEDWNPVDGFTRAEDLRAGRQLEPWPGEVYSHGLGFVPGHWFVNLSGGIAPDGYATFEDAIPNAIDLDFTLSQLGRGVRYNAAPQLAITGEIRNAQVVRGPMSFLHLDAAVKTEDGETRGEGKASLLEMNGSAIVAGLQLLEFERNLALESIAASRKDPEKMKGILSGRAMEYLEEDSSDLIMELRSSYGEDGLLPLLRKVCRATRIIPESAVAGLGLAWPRLFVPTPAEMAQLIPALRDAVTPIVDPASTPVKPMGGGARPTATQPPGRPPTGPVPQKIETIGALMDLEKAKLFISQALDLELLEDEADDADPAPLEPSNEVTADAPPPLPPDPFPDPEGAQNPSSETVRSSGPISTGIRDAFAMNVGPAVNDPNLP